MNDTEKLIYGRNAINEYLDIIRIKGIKTNKDIDDLNNKLNEIGMNKNTFYSFNTTQNFLEVDRCFRFRKKDNPEEIAICDNCVGRCSIKCYDPIEELRKKFLSGCMENGIDYIYSLNHLTPNSKIIEEQRNELQRLNLEADDYFVLTPLATFLTHDFNFTWPDFCVGFAYKINEPKFDPFWRMDRIVKFGHYIYNCIIESKI